MVKYREYFDKMCQENKPLFDEFLFIHNLYEKNKKANQVVFNELGAKVRRVVESWDKKLCGRMERGSHASYSKNLSDKFWGEVRKLFPLIDYVGVIYK